MELSNCTDNNGAGPTKQIFILSGQSNMAGRGGVDKYKHWDGVVPPECSPDSHRIFRLNAHLHWEAAREPLHHDIDTRKTCGVGPGMAFSNAVKERVGMIGLVPCAVGGTAIKEWARGMHLYDNMVKRAKAAAEDGGEIRAVLWYQGESDTTSQQEVDCYKEKMETLIHNLRQDLAFPTLPIIQVAIGSDFSLLFGYLRTIRKSYGEIMAASALYSSSLCCYASIPDVRVPGSAKTDFGSRKFGTAFATGSPLLIQRPNYNRKMTCNSKAISIRCEQSTKEGGGGLDVWLGRLAMVGFAAAISVEIATGKGFLENFGLTTPLPTVALAVTALVGALTAVFIFQSASKN